MEIAGAEDDPDTGMIENCEQRESQSHRRRLEFENCNDINAIVENTLEEDALSPGVNLIADNKGINLIHSRIPKELIPELGMEFETEDAARKFYNAYAFRVGFSTRLSKFHKDDNGKVLDIVFCCSCQGTHKKATKKKTHQKKIVPPTVNPDFGPQLDMESNGTFNSRIDAVTGNYLSSQATHYMQQPNVSGYNLNMAVRPSMLSSQLFFNGPPRPRKQQYIGAYNSRNDKHGFGSMMNLLQPQLPPGLRSSIAFGPNSSQFTGNYMSYGAEQQLKE